MIFIPCRIQLDSSKAQETNYGKNNTPPNCTLKKTILLFPVAIQSVFLKLQIQKRVQCGLPKYLRPSTNISKRCQLRAPWIGMGSKELGLEQCISFFLGISCHPRYCCSLQAHKRYGQLWKSCLICWVNSSLTTYLHCGEIVILPPERTATAICITVLLVQ